jgi:hypothetical protein
MKAPALTYEYLLRSSADKNINHMALGTTPILMTTCAFTKNMAKSTLVALLLMDRAPDVEVDYRDASEYGSIHALFLHTHDHASVTWLIMLLSCGGKLSLSFSLSLSLSLFTPLTE